MAGIYNIVIEKGYPYTRTIRWKDETGNYVDLTGYSVELIITNLTSKKVIATYVSGDLITFTDNVGGFTINIPATQTNFLPSGEHSYVLRMIVGQEPEKLLEGKFRVSA